MKCLLVLIIASCACARMIPNNGKIVGGHTAVAGQFPYQVSLKYGNQHVCGGSIINQRTVLTAAHCPDGLQAGAITVYVGSTKLNGGGVDHTITKFILHGNWNAAVATDDIAIMHVQNPISYTANVQPIRPDDSFTEANTPCIMSGWGVLNYPAQDETNDLQYFEGAIFDLAGCKQIFQGGNYPVLDTNICAYSKPGQGACRGDSGGPLVANGKQVGLASWVALCATGVPDVFTRVSSYVGWIQTNTVN